MDINKEKDIRCFKCNADASKVVEFYEDGDWDVIDIIELKEKLRAASSQSRVNDQHRMLYQGQRDDEREKLKKIGDILNPNTDPWRQLADIRGILDT